MVVDRNVPIFFKVIINYSMDTIYVYVDGLFVSLICATYIGLLTKMGYSLYWVVIYIQIVIGAELGKYI